MGRNRVIYQSESLFVSEDVNSTSATDHNELIRVQGANYGFTINRTDVNQFGTLARIDSLVLEPPTVNFDFSYYLTDGKNEGHLGFSVKPDAQFVSGFLEASSGRNFYIVTSDEGQDSTTFNNSDPYSIIGVGNAFLTDYTVDLSVGALPTASASFEASNISSQNGNVSAQKITGQLPSIRPEDGTIIEGYSTMNIPANTGQDGPTALRPGDIELSFPGFEGGESVSGTLSNIDGGVGSFHIQSASISIPLSRSPISRLGSKFPYARVVDFPVNATMNVNAILNTVEAGNLARIIAGCGGAESTKDVSITLKSCEGDPAMVWTLKGATLDSESFSSSIGSNKSVDLTFGVQIGGIDDIDQGIIFSGSHDFGNRAPNIEFIGTQQNNDDEVISLQVNATDPEGDNITYNAINLPAGLSIDANNGLINGTINTNAYQSSPYNVTIEAIDDGEPQKTGTANFTWEVYQANTPPTITQISNQTNYDEDVVSLQVNVNDAENDTLTYSAQGLPAGLSIDQNGLIGGTIADGANASSPYNVTVQVVDDGFPPLTGTESFTWTVNEVVALTPTIAYSDAAKTIEFSSVQGDIPDSWMSNSGISGVTFGSSATYVDNNAFLGNNIVEINLPSNITGLGSSSFFVNPDLESINLGSGVLSVGNSAFQNVGANVDTTLNLGSSVQYIGIASFRQVDCEINLPESLTGIGNQGFQENTGVSYITFPPNLVSVGNDAFSSCDNLSGIDLSNVSDGSVFGYSFRYNDSLTGVSIPDHWTGISDLCFAYSQNLEGLYLGTGLTTIGQRAFDRCGITGTLQLPPNLVTINQGAFQNGGGNPVISPSVANVFTGIDFPLNNTLETIGSNAFYRVRSIKYVNIPDSVSSVGTLAFSDNDSLTGVVIDSGVTSIDSSCFNLCAALTGVTINCPTGSWVGTNAFANTPSGTYKITGAYFADYTGSSWSGDQAIAAGSVFECYGDGCPGPPAPLSWNQLGNTISGDSAGDNFGETLSMTKDGQFVLVGDQWFDGGGQNNRGFAELYENVGGNWTLTGAREVGEVSPDELGSAVAVANSGLANPVMAIGVRDQDGGAGADVGEILFFELNGNSFDPKGNNSSILGDTQRIYLGSSASFSADGSVCAVGAPGNVEFDAPNTTTSGHVEVYQWNTPTANEWNQMGANITGVGTASQDEFGCSVALSSDGTYLIVGARYNDAGGNAAGKAYVYQSGSPNWTQRGTSAPEGSAAFDEFGTSVSISADGSVIAAGAPNNSDGGLSAGHVKLLNWSSPNYVTRGAAITGAAGDLFGSSVSLSDDGNTVAIGAPGGDYVRIFKWNTPTPNQWNQLGEDITGANSERFGETVCLSADGLTVAVGAPDADVDPGGGEGNVRIFTYS